MKAAADKATTAAVVSAATIAELRADNLRLTEALESLRLRADSEKRAAIFEASIKASDQLLQRYKDGLRDGASLTRGGLNPVNLASLTPDSSVNTPVS